MPEDEALQLLTGRPDPQALPPAELAAAKDLAAELGHLPLALAQARAYMAETGKSLAGYLRLFRSSRPADFAADAAEPRLSGELRHHLADLDRRRRGRLPRRAAAAGAAGVPGPRPAADRGAGGRSAALPEDLRASTRATTPSPPCAATR